MNPYTLVLLTACGSDPQDGSETTPGPVETYESTLSDIEDATIAHGDAVLAATDADAVSGQESAFWSVCRDEWDQMGSCWDAMSGCGMMMGGNDQDAWWSWMNDMWDSMQAHHETMAHCSDPADCHAVETDWQSHMADMFDHMHGMSANWPDDCHW